MSGDKPSVSEEALQRAMEAMDASSNLALAMRVRAALDAGLAATLRERDEARAELAECGDRCVDGELYAQVQADRVRVAARVAYLEITKDAQRIHVAELRARIATLEGLLREADVLLEYAIAGCAERPDFRADVQVWQKRVSPTALAQPAADPIEHRAYSIAKLGTETPPEAKAYEAGTYHIEPEPRREERPVPGEVIEAMFDGRWMRGTVLMCGGSEDGVCVNLGQSWGTHYVAHEWRRVPAPQLASAEPGGVPGCRCEGCTFDRANRVEPAAPSQAERTGDMSHDYDGPIPCNPAQCIHSGDGVRCSRHGVQPAAPDADRLTAGQLRDLASIIINANQFSDTTNLMYDALRAEADRRARAGKAGTNG